MDRSVVLERWSGGRLPRAARWPTGYPTTSGIRASPRWKATLDELKAKMAASTCAGGPTCAPSSTGSSVPGQWSRAGLATCARSRSADPAAQTPWRARGDRYF